jgi:pimeloyl-ACP methyl ester carboxylesterase
VHYVEAGEGMPVLLLPGWLQTWYACRDLILPLAERGFRVIAADLRGMGHTDWPSSGYDTGQLAKDMNGLMNRLGYRRYAVVGHDVGMWVGYAMAADYPDAVEKIVLMEGGIPGLADHLPKYLCPKLKAPISGSLCSINNPTFPNSYYKDASELL